MAETVGNSSKLPVRNWAFTSKTRPGFEVSDPDRPAVAYKPATDIPVTFMDMELKDWVVMPKGLIVAIDSNGFLVPANGGDTTNGAYAYTIDDQNAGVRKADGTLAVAGDTASVTANIPVGVLPLDVYQDTKGRYLNYKLQSDAIGILCERVVEVPYFTYADLGSPATAALAAAAAKAKINALAYAQTSGGDLANGDFVQSDANGRFMKWTPANAAAPTAAEIQQIVGQVLLVDVDFPKDMLQYVQTYPYSETPGTETGGMPGHLAAVGATKAVRIRLKF